MQTARLFTEDRVALWTSSLWFGCSPFILFELTEGRPTQAIVGVLCLFLRSLWRSTQRDRIGSAVAAGLLLAVAGYQYWFYAFFGGMAALAHGLMRTARPPPDTPRLGILARAWTSPRTPHSGRSRTEIPPPACSPWGPSRYHLCSTEYSRSGAWRVSGPHE